MRQGGDAQHVEHPEGGFLGIATAMQHGRVAFSCPPGHLEGLGGHPHEFVEEDGVLLAGEREPQDLVEAGAVLGGQEDQAPVGTGDAHHLRAHLLAEAAQLVDRLLIL